MAFQQRDDVEVDVWDGEDPVGTRGESLLPSVNTGTNTVVKRRARASYITLFGFRWMRGWI